MEAKMAEKSAAQKSEPNGISKASQEKKKFAPGKSPLKIKFRKIPILLIAPHGVLGNDDNTNLLAKDAAKELKCSVIINDSVKREELDYNIIKDARKDPKILPAIRSFLKKNNHALVVWIHGIDTENLNNEEEKMGVQKDSVDCLIGYGQPDGHTARPETIAALQKLFKQQVIEAIPTRDDAPKYRGWAKSNMNQWFRQPKQKKYNDLNRVQSIQLEFAMSRRRKDVVPDTAKRLSNVLNGLINPPEGKKDTKLPVAAIPSLKKSEDHYPDSLEKDADDTLVDKAYRFLEGIFSRHFYGALLEAGQYLVKEFYGDDYERAHQKKMIKDKSLHRLIQRLQEGTGDAPSPAWIYNAVKIAVDDRRLAEVSIYRNLPQSHKVLLAYIKDDETKKKLIEESVEKKLTVAELRERIKEIKSGNRLDYHLPEERFRDLEIKVLEKLQRMPERDLSEHKKECEKIETSLKRISGVIAEKAKVKVGKRPVKKG